MHDDDDDAAWHGTRDRLYMTAASAAQGFHTKRVTCVLVYVTGCVGGRWSSSRDSMRHF